MVTRYDKRLEAEDLWQVFEIETGRVVMIAGQPYDGMAKHEAAEIVALLEGGILTADTNQDIPSAEKVGPDDSMNQESCPDIGRDATDEGSTGKS